MTAAATESETEDVAAEEAESYAERAGASAAAAIGQLLSLSPGGDASQVLQEYLAGLIEEGPVADALASLAGRLGGSGADDPGQVLNPDDAENAAATSEISSPVGSGSGDNGTYTGGDNGSDSGDGGGDDGGDGSGGE